MAELKILKALPEHFEDYFFLRCDNNNILWSGHKQAPDHEKLKNWYLQNIKRADRLFFLCYENNESEKIAGYLYLDITGEKKNTVEIGYGVYHMMNSKGYGTEIITFAKKYTMTEITSAMQIDAWVAANNIGSIKVFIKNGFVKTEETKYTLFEKTGENELFEKYNFNIKN